MLITQVQPQANWNLFITAKDGRVGCFDVAPYLQFEAFQALSNIQEFQKVSTGGYFVEWESGADLSADTIEARWVVID